MQGCCRAGGPAAGAGCFQAVLSDLISNKALVVPVCAWALAQLLKGLLDVARERRFGLDMFVSSGGMPSSHSAMVSCLATVVALTSGVGSVAFAVSVVLAMIVMYDAAGVRRAVSNQAVILNRLVRELRLRRPRGEVERDLRELIGHTPFQVIAGAAIGVTMAWLWIFLS